MKRILIISPAVTVKGGISSVLKVYLCSKLIEKNRLYFVASHVDGSKLLKFLVALKGLILTIENLIFHRIDVMHIHGSGDRYSLRRKYFFFLLGRLFKCKIIFHLHGGYFNENYSESSQKWKKRFKHLLNKADLVICLSKSWEKNIRKISDKAKIKVIPNSIFLSKIDSRKNSIKTDIVITYLGLVSKNKGTFDLLKVIRKLIQNKYKVRLLIGGHGDIKKLTSETVSLSLQEHVKYLGWLSVDQKSAVLNETDIYIIPSYGEGMPMSILEAMANRLPVVSTKVGGIPEMIVEGVNGFMVEPGDIESMYKRVALLVENIEIREKMGNNGRKIAEEIFNAEKRIAEIDRCYQTI